MQDHEVNVFVGGRLRSFRTARRLSLEELGGSIGLSYQQIQKYETGTNRLSASAMWHLSKALGVGIGDFFPSEGDEENAHDVLSIRAASALSRMDHRIRVIIVDLIDAIARRESGGV